MNENKFLKLFGLLAFLAFAAVSCWATAESFHLLLSSWPLAMCWVVTIGFFFIASWGTKMIVDSLNQKIYLEKRGLRLFGGILILLIFWLACSMPTNTHTFFYRSVINDKVTNDLTTTEGYLMQIRDNATTEARIKIRLAELEKKVDVKLGELKAEIENDANPGFGPKAKEILRDFAEILGVVKIEPLTFKGTSIQDRQKLYDAYRQKMYILMEAKKLNIIKEMTPSNNNHQKQADKDYKNLVLVKKYVEDGTLNLNDAEDIKSICDKLNAGYATIRTYKQFVDFKDETDQMTYTAPNAVTKVKRMISVFDVWEDYLAGQYAGHGFFFWVLISILVDVAAFIFFDIAFKKRED
ncbi:MAG: hypothetical protein J6K41_03695 [Paraprevotella sp.]|nr:hypothetical protein [Paraprevotella sp.]